MIKQLSKAEKLNYTRIGLTIRKMTTLILAVVWLYNSYAQQGLVAEYYDGTNFERLVAVKKADQIDMYWNNVPPVPGMDPHECSIRWTSQLVPAKSGKYKFTARVDDGIRVWIDDQLIIDNWKLNDVGISQGSIDLEAFQSYDLRVEYFNALIEGEIRLLWDIPEGSRNWFSNLLGNQFKVIGSDFFHMPPNFRDMLALDPIQDQILENSEIPNTQVVLSPPASSKPAVEERVRHSSGDDYSILASNSEVIDEVQNVLVMADDYIPRNIQFERAKTTILSSSFNELDRFVSFMKDYPALHVKIEGHTDPVGPEEQNQKLSEQRAYKVANYLVKKGIEPGRIEAEGFGGSKPLVIPAQGE